MGSRGLSLRLRVAYRRVTGRALARWMSHAADGRREPLVREGNTITAMMGRGRLGGAQC